MVYCSRELCDAKGIWDYREPESETIIPKRRYHDERAEFRLLRDALEKWSNTCSRQPISRLLTISLAGRDPKRSNNLLRSYETHAQLNDTRRHDIHANMTTYESSASEQGKPGSRIWIKQSKKMLT